jgi:hypothetical protein
VAGAKYASYSRAFDKSDVRPFAVKLPAGEKQGLVDISTGRWIIPPRYEKIKQLSNIRGMGNDYLDDVLAVKVDGQWGVADKDGNYLVVPQYSEISYRGEGLLFAMAGGAEYEAVANGALSTGVAGC